MFVSIYYKPSLFNAHTMILIVHIFMNVNNLCLNQNSFDQSFIWSGPNNRVGEMGKNFRVCVLFCLFVVFQWVVGVWCTVN